MVKSRALAVKARMLKTATRVLRRMASTSAPAGTWLAMAVTVPMLSATPMDVWVQPAVVR